MRLLNTRTLELENFATPEEARYAILSHTWGEGEVIFADVHLPQKETRGWEKIRRSSEIATNLGFAYIWIDTCCIDKTSSAELSEAINSMYQWYEKAEVCIAFLEDLVTTDDPPTPYFAQCRWFSRGWTLQELIAPPELLFYSQDWELIGTRTSLKSIIAEVSSIPEEVLEVNTRGQRERLDECSVAEKMSWAANRTTTRPEDLAYCLLGIFDINMPLLYGEGQVKAFRRLQEEIIRSTDDDSIYVWTYPEAKAKKQHFWGLLADDPSAFARPHRDAYAIKRARYLTCRSNNDTTISNRGLTVELALTPFPEDESGTVFVALLDCDIQLNEYTETITPGILLQKMTWHNDAEFVRIRPDYLLILYLNCIVMVEDSSGNGHAPPRGHVGLSEARPRQVFVPHKLSPPRSPRGILFYPKISIRPQLPDLVVNVLSKPPRWQLYDEMPIARVIDIPMRLVWPGLHSSRLRTKPYVLDFDESSNLGATERAMMLGYWKLKIDQLGGNPQHVCLVTGLEPLPRTPYGTPSLYTVPWYSFIDEPNVWEGWPAGGLAKKDRREHMLLWGVRMLTAHFSLEARNSKLYYIVVLEEVAPGGQLNGAEDEDGA